MTKTSKMRNKEGHSKEKGRDGNSLQTDALTNKQTINKQCSVTDNKQ